MPWEIVFALNGAGDTTPPGGVERPVVCVVDPAPGAPGVVGVVVCVIAPAGLVSGEKTTPSAYSERFSPYCLARVRFTSRISTSMTISARGLSFCRMIFSMIWTTLVDPRTTRVLPDLFTEMIGGTPSCGSRMTELSSCDMSLTSACAR